MSEVIMDPEVKKLWVYALRSGDYEQGKGRLKNGDKYCCLGVLCDLHSKSGLESSEEWNGGSYKHLNSVLSKDVLEWSGLDRNNGDFVIIDQIESCLTYHNDREKTFNQIADAIEEQL